MAKAVIFDVDGTLVNSVDLHAEPGTGRLPRLWARLRVRRYS